MFLRLYSSKQSGFSLIEVLITAAIIGIVTVILVARYGAFNSSTLLKAQAFELALDIREAQVFAISVRGEGGNFREEYGLFFSTSGDWRQQYQLFLDDEPNSVGIEGGDDRFNSGEEVGDPYRLDSRISIVDIRVNDCNDSVNNLSIAFERPDFDAILTTVQSGNSPQSHNEVCIVLSDSEGAVERKVVVTATGQITVE